MGQIKAPVSRTFFFIIFLTTQVLAQDQGVRNQLPDSLNKVLNGIFEDTIKLQVLLQAVSQQAYSDTVFSLRLINEYGSLARKADSRFHTLKSIYYLGKYYQYCKKDVHTGIKHYEKCADLAIEYNRNDIAVISFIEIAQAYEYVNSNLLALENYYKAINLKPPPDVCQGIYGNMGEVYNTMGDYARALYYYEKTYEIKNRQMALAGNKNRNDTLVLMLLQINMAGIHITMNQPQEALNGYKNVQALNAKIKNSQIDIYSLQGIGKCLLLNNAITAAIPFFDTALQISTTIHDNVASCNLLNNIGTAYLKQNNIYKAQQCAAKALQIETLKHDTLFSYVLQCLPDTYSLLADIAARKQEVGRALYYINLVIKLYAQANRQHDESEAWGKLSNIYQRTGNISGAFAAYKRQISLRDSVFNQEKAIEITRIELTGEFYRKQMADSLLQAQRDLLDTEELQAQKKTNYFFMVGSIIFLLISAGSIYFLIYTRKAKAQIELLMKEMHHRVKNNLQIISTLLNLQLADIPDERARKTIEEGITRISSIALIHHHLYQKDGLSSIEISGFAEELYKQVFALYGRSDQQLQQHFEIPGTRLDIDTAIPLGLILNELITNSFKYAYQNTNICQVFIKLIKANNMYTIEYNDRGPGLSDGFNPETSASLGMRLIQNLCSQLDGSFYYRKTDRSFIINFKDTIVRRKTA